MDKSVYQAYEDEIRALEEEIRLLTEKYEDIRQESTFFSDEEILKSIKSFQQETQGETKGQEYPSDLKAELESLGTDLSFFMTLTGFQFTSHSKKTVEKTEKRTVQKHRLSGKCHSLSFQLEFQLLEMQNNEKVSAVVSDLSIVMESREDSDVSKFVSSTEEHGNLLTFFRSLSAYAEWYEHRRRTFLHFKVKISSPVSYLSHQRVCMGLRSRMQCITNLCQWEMSQKIESGNLQNTVKSLKLKKKFANQL
ncbi:centromere protein P isoform 3-T4 [Cyanocitta cristata]